VDTLQISYGLAIGGYNDSYGKTRGERAKAVFSHKKAQKAQNDFPLLTWTFPALFCALLLSLFTETRFYAKHGARGAGSTRPESEL
jgi:hypothetical protein